MRTANPELEANIKTQGLALLLEKEPEEIGMRDIARACGVSATSIYYYYRDKEQLFEHIKLDCLDAMEAFVRERVADETSTDNKIRAGLRAFRDWALSNPRVALLVMGRFKPLPGNDPVQLRRYYRSNELAKELLDAAVAEGLMPPCDTRLESALIIAALWGVLESVILKRTWPEYWDSAFALTDRMIDRLYPAQGRQGV